MQITPLLKELYLHITPQYAADWKVIGTLLGLPTATLTVTSLKMTIYKISISNNEALPFVFIQQYLIVLITP